MKVFLSWSGPRSKEVAEILRDWLELAVQALNPWMSAEDIDKGAAWDNEIVGNLVDAKAGIVCVTPENQTATWLNFEAGALARTVGKTMVCTYLVGLNPAEVKGPLSRFQHTVANKQDTRRLLHTLNKALEGHGLSERIVNETFDTWWPKLEAKLKEIESVTTPKIAARTPEDMLEEVLLLTRDQGKQMTNILRNLFSARETLLTRPSQRNGVWAPDGNRETHLRHAFATDDDWLKGEPKIEQKDSKSALAVTVPEEDAGLSDT